MAFSIETPDGFYIFSSYEESYEILPVQDIEAYDRKFLKDCGIVPCKF